METTALTNKWLQPGMLDRTTNHRMMRVDRSRADSRGLAQHRLAGQEIAFGPQM